jgi:hypothetical protein
VSNVILYDFRECYLFSGKTIALSRTKLSKENELRRVPDSHILPGVEFCGVAGRHN